MQMEIEYNSFCLKKFFSGMKVGTVKNLLQKTEVKFRNKSMRKGQEIYKRDGMNMKIKKVIISELINLKFYFTYRNFKTNS